MNWRDKNGIETRDDTDHVGQCLNHVRRRHHKVPQVAMVRERSRYNMPQDTQIPRQLRHGR